VLHLSAGQWVFYGVLSLVWAFLGYRLSENDRRVLGRTPWGLPSLLWAFFWFLSLVLGLILYLIAHSTGVRQAQRNANFSGAPGAGSPPTMARTPGKSPTASDLFPAYPRPANQTPAQVDVPVDDQQDVSSAVEHVEGADATDGDAAAATTSPPSWHPDPSGRFHYRWWNGTQWTSQVSTDGHHLIDTNPDQRIGPY
jgi:hypothetical protein